MEADCEGEGKLQAGQVHRRQTVGFHADFAAQGWKGGPLQIDERNGISRIFLLAYSCIGIVMRSIYMRQKCRSQLRFSLVIDLIFIYGERNLYTMENVSGGLFTFFHLKIFICNNDAVANRDALSLPPAEQQARKVSRFSTPGCAECLWEQAWLFDEKSPVSGHTTAPLAGGVRFAQQRRQFACRWRA
ncbi:hypothetical protein [Cupriavidus numazuensis]|uniref:hypothetical protein n=1 Tax=Cupriavidus numazuensis TaxID=221992 RepID=UPI001BA88EE1|nr:hypothetical protein [Cupriavidus numazuensis]